MRTSLSTPRSSVAREQQPLAVGRGQVEQRGDGGQEAEVGHVVGLVQHGDLDLRQVALALVDEVLQAAGGGDDDVDAAAQLVDLAAHRRAAVDGGDLEVERLRQRRELVVDLLRELAGRHEHERAGGAAGAAAADEAGQQRQAEGERLARAGLAAAEDVPAGEGVGQRPDLDGERRGHAAALQRGHQASAGRPSWAKVGTTSGARRRRLAAASSGEVERRRAGGRARGAARRTWRPRTGRPDGRVGRVGAGRHRCAPSVLRGRDVWCSAGA